jgi:hypothetical protein
MKSLFEKLRETRRRKDRVRSHIQSMRCCWPEWEGPRVEDSVHGLCSVHSCCVHSITHGETRYHYMAPCVIESISEDGETIIAVIQYDESAPEHCRDDNGEKLRLDITEVWAPTATLWTMYHAAQVAEAIEQGITCQCGGIPAHAYGGGFECAACHTARLTPPEKPKKPAKKSKKAKP